MSGKFLQTVGSNLRDKFVRQITIDSVRNRDVIMRNDLYDNPDAEDTETHTGQVRNHHSQISRYLRFVTVKLLLIPPS